MRISPAKADRLSGFAEEYYTTELPYHNWDHPGEVNDAMQHLLRQGGEKSRAISRGLAQIAAYWHDAGYDHTRADEFPSKEHYSAWLMRGRLRRELRPYQLAQLEDAILATRFGVQRTGAMGIALHYGDVANIGSADYDDFYGHSVQLWQEYGRPDWHTFLESSQRVIGQTAQESYHELPLIGVDPNEYAEHARRNLKTILTESQPGGL